MDITEKFLVSKNAHSFYLRLFSQYRGDKETKVFIRAMIDIKKYEFANWLIVQFLDREQEILYGITIAEYAADIFGNVYPDDSVLRDTIAEMKIYIKNKNKTTKEMWVTVVNKLGNAANKAEDGAYHAFGDVCDPYSTSTAIKDAIYAVISVCSAIAKGDNMCLSFEYLHGAALVRSEEIMRRVLEHGIELIKKVKEE